MEDIILVDQEDKQVGTGEKMEVHRQGKLHRSFSIFIFNSKDELLVAQRAQRKYHCGGLWSNTCCSHPRPGEDIEQAAHRRLKEEMGFDTDLQEVFTFVYNVELDKGMKEHEFDHVFVGTFDGDPIPNPEEVGEMKYADPEDLVFDMKSAPEKYTPWFKISFERVLTFVPLPRTFTESHG